MYMKPSAILAARSNAARLDPPSQIGIERVERSLGFLHVDREAVAFLAAEERDHAIATLVEALLLFESEHLLAHLRFPQLDDFLGGEDVLLFEDFLYGEKTGLIDEDRALVLLHRVDDRAKRLRRPLDDFFQRRDALEQMLIEREILFLLVLLDLVFLERRDAGEHEQLVLAAIAILAFVVVIRATGLTEHGRFRALKHFVHFLYS